MNLEQSILKDETANHKEKEVKAGDLGFIQEGGRLKGTFRNYKIVIGELGGVYVYPPHVFAEKESRNDAIPFERFTGNIAAELVDNAPLLPKLRKVKELLLGEVREKITKVLKRAEQSLTDNGALKYPYIYFKGVLESGGIFDKEIISSAYNKIHDKYKDSSPYIAEDFCKALAMEAKNVITNEFEKFESAINI